MAAIIVLITAVNVIVYAREPNICLLIGKCVASGTLRDWLPLNSCNRHFAFAHEPIGRIIDSSSLYDTTAPSSIN